MSPGQSTSSIRWPRREPSGWRTLVGYEINFNRYFYRYTPPRPIEEIETDIRGIEQDILQMLAEVTGSQRPAVPWETVDTCV